jgi:ketosteroid isomerase-like protein
MSEENVALVRKFAEAMQSEDWERAAGWVHPELKGHGTVGGLDEGRVFHGLPALVHAFEIEDAEAWEERRIEPTDYVDGGDVVVILIHEFRRGKSSGVELETDTAVTATVRDGRIVLLRAYMDQAVALQAAGLSDDY